MKKHRPHCVSLELTTDCYFSLDCWLKQNGIGEFALLGPAPCPILKINYNFRYRLTLRCQVTRPVRLMLAQLLRLFQQDRQHRGLNAWVDVNGYD